MSKIKSNYKKILCFIFAILSTFSLNMRNTLYVGNCPENKIGNIVSRIHSVFEVREFADIIMFAALFAFFVWAIEKIEKINIGTWESKLEKTRRANL